MNTATVLWEKSPGYDPLLGGRKSFSGPEADEDNRIASKRILLVEDDQMVRESIARLLRQEAHTVVEANNGAEAFALFLSGQFDLVMTDFEIPFVKGNELAVRIKRLVPGQPILMITGYGKRPGLCNPVDAVLNKPFNLNQMRSALARLFPRVGASFPA